MRAATASPVFWRAGGLAPRPCHSGDAQPHSYGYTDGRNRRTDTEGPGPRLRWHGRGDPGPWLLGALRQVGGRAGRRYRPLPDGVRLPDPGAGCLGEAWRPSTLADVRNTLRGDRRCGAVFRPGFVEHGRAL